MQTFAKKTNQIVSKNHSNVKKRPVEYPDSFLNTSFTKKMLTL
jgi:hypothetical protein